MDTQQENDDFTSQILEHDALLDQFEQCWKRGQSPRIEDFLTQQDHRLLLFRELLVIEVTWRIKLSDCPIRQEYLARFSDLGTQIEEAFQIVDQQKATDKPVSSTLDASVQQVEHDTHDDSSAPSPKELGDYEILEELGRGGMGVVYKAHQKGAERVVALKIIRSDRLGMVSGDMASRALSRFQKEAQATARISHDNIVTVFDVSQVDGQHYYTMEFVAGPNLAELCADTAIDARDAARLAQDIARGLSEAHSQGVLHRDVKPHNVLVAQKGGARRAMLVDFGLAKLMDAEPMTMDNATLGTLDYMAPEQAKDTANVDERADVYGLGATLYHMLAGKPPFQAPSGGETIQKILNEWPVPLRDANASVDERLDFLCLSCLEKHPDDRYQTADDVARDLEHWLKDEPLERRPEGVVKRAIRWCRRNPASATLIAVTVTAILVAVGSLAFNPNETPAPNTVIVDREREPTEDEIAEMAEINGLFEKHDRVLFVLDVSASMQARSGNGSRLDEAKAKLHRALRGMRRENRKRQIEVQPLLKKSASLITWSNDVAIVKQETPDLSDLRSGGSEVWTTDPEALSRQIAAASHTVLENDFSALMELLTVMYSERGGAKDVPIVFVTDGCFERGDPNAWRTLADNTSGPSDVYSWHVGDTDVLNLAIREFRLHDKEANTVVAVIQNYAQQESETTIAFYQDDRDEALDTKSVTIASGQQQQVTFEVPLAKSDSFTVKLLSEDALPLDDTAFLVVQREERPKVLLVTEGNEPVEQVIRASGRVEVRIETPGYLDSKPYESSASDSTYDFIIFDRCSPDSMPNSNTLFIGRSPPNVDCFSEQIYKDLSIREWNEFHPLMEHQQLDKVAILQGRTIRLPEGAQELFTTEHGPVGAILPLNGYESVVLSFEIVGSVEGSPADPRANTNWTYSLSFPKFIDSALDYLCQPPHLTGPRDVIAGDAVRLSPADPNDSMYVIVPDGKRIPVELNAAVVEIYFTDTDQPGVYILAVEPERPVHKFAVNFVGGRESDVNYRSTLDGKKHTAFLIESSNPSEYFNGACQRLLQETLPLNRNAESYEVLLVNSTDANAASPLDRFAKRGAKLRRTTIPRALAEDSPFPVGVTKRVVVVTNGHYDYAELEAVFAAAQKRGVAIDVVVVPDFPQDISVRVGSARKIKQGETLTLDIFLENTEHLGLASRVVSGSVKVTRVDEDGQQIMIENREVDLEPGTNRLKSASPPGAPGLYTFAVAFTPGRPEFDHRAVNNRATTFVEVVPVARLLFVADELDTALPPSLAETLRAKGVEFETYSYRDKLPDLTELAHYDAVVLNDVPRRWRTQTGEQERISQEWTNQLVTATRDFGVGLVFFGGRNAFQAQRWSGSILERALPVKFRPEKSANCLILILGGEQTEEPGDNWRELAEQMVASLHPDDLFGVLGSTEKYGGRWEWLSFEDEAHLYRAADWGERLEAMRSAKLYRSWQIDGALGKVLHELQDHETLRNKHLVLHHRNNINLDPPSNRLLTQLLESDIRAHVIRSGNPRVTGNHRNITRFTGGVLVVNLEDQSDKTRRIAALMANKATGGFLQDIHDHGPTTLRLAAGDEAAGTRHADLIDSMRELMGQELPPMFGIGITSPKVGALVLESNAPDVPLAAFGRHGLGRVALFAGDLNGDWCDSWRDSPEGTRFFQRLILSTTTKKVLHLEHRVREISDQQIEIEIELLDQEQNEELFGGDIELSGALVPEDGDDILPLMFRREPSRKFIVRSKKPSPGACQIQVVAPMLDFAATSFTVQIDPEPTYKKVERSLRRIAETPASDGRTGSVSTFSGQ